ncbi:MAG: hypothetical protein E5V63_04210 [Mesorhizobium sp.]|nr:MAG: hypothetical protein E5V63_04210 [Mesorhizobium sp.]
MMRHLYGMAVAALSAATAQQIDLSSIIALPEAPSRGVPNYHRRINRSRYMPHQGKRECARRLRQMQKMGEMKP